MNSTYSRTTGAFPEPTRHDVIRDSFYISFHDITPRFEQQIRRIVDALRPHLDRQWGAAIVPRWHGDSSENWSSDFLTFIKDTFQEIMLHGYHHRRSKGGGLVSLIAGGADEFNGLTLKETEEKLGLGQRAMVELLGQSANGFIAPTFQQGLLNSQLLAKYDIDFIVGFYETQFGDGRVYPLNSWCWDMGESRWLSRLGDLYSSFRYRLRGKRAIPQLTIHPVDIDRGYLPRIVELTQRLFDTGRSPMLMGDYVTD